MIESALIIQLFVFLFGLLIGSFLNVCIHRLPLSISLVTPRSNCPNCKKEIAFYDNIPVLSYLLILGRCRNCRAPISPRYPIVEITSGLFALGLFSRHGLTLDTIVLYVFICSLLVITFIDIDFKIIPDVITYPGIIIGFLSSLLVDRVTYRDSLIGILLGGGLLYLVATLYYLLRHQEGMGGGDIKLLAMIGAFLGWKAVIFTIFVGSVFGTAAGLAVALRTRHGAKTAIPFGPFLSIASMLYIFEGPRIINLYFGIYS